MTGKEEPQPNPVDLAREKFNKSMVETYSGQSLIDGIIGLQNALLQTGDPKEVFRELSNSSAKALSRAAASKDNETGTKLEGLKNGYDLALKNFTPVPKEEKKAPSDTKGKKMSGAKG